MPDNPLPISRANKVIEHMTDIKPEDSTRAARALLRESKRKLKGLYKESVKRPPSAEKPDPFAGPRRNALRSAVAAFARRTRNQAPSGQSPQPPGIGSPKSNPGTSAPLSPIAKDLLLQSPASELSQHARKELQNFQTAVRTLFDSPVAQKSGLPRQIPISEKLQAEILPTNSAQLINFTSINTVQLTTQDKKTIAALEHWIGTEVPRLAGELEEKHSGQPPPELALLAATLSDPRQINIWINLAILMVMGGYEEWELHGIEFDAQELTTLILAELKSFFEQEDFSKKHAPYKLTVLEDTVRCTFKTPNSAAGISLSYEDVQNRKKHARQHWLRLEQRDSNTNLEKPLRQAETAINQRISEKKKELARRYPEKSPRQVLPKFVNYTWEDLAAYSIIRDTDPTAALLEEGAQ